jgi:hypothetical protein
MDHAVCGIMLLWDGLDPDKAMSRRDGFHPEAEVSEVQCWLSPFWWPFW